MLEVGLNEGDCTTSKRILIFQFVNAISQSRLGWKLDFIRKEKEREKEEEARNV